MSEADLLKQAKSGSIDAQIELGIRAAEGGKRDLGSAISWLRRAAHSKSIFAMHLMADYTSMQTDGDLNRPVDNVDKKKDIAADAAEWRDRANETGKSGLNALLADIAGEGISSKSYLKAMTRKDIKEPKIKKLTNQGRKGGGGKILIVDDDPGVRVTLKAIVEANGYSAVTAEDGKIAFSMLAEHPDLKAVLCDYSLPHLNGLKFVMVVQKMKMLEGIPIFMVSGRCSPELIKKGAQLGVAGWIVKPFDRERIEAVLSSIVSIAA